MKQGLKSQIWIFSQFVMVPNQFESTRKCTWCVQSIIYGVPAEPENWTRNVLFLFS